VTRAAALWLAALLAAAPWAAAAGDAPLWGYVDGAGVAHVADQRLDTRYRPLLGSVADDHVPGKTDSTGGLLTWLEIAPQVRALRPWLREAADAHGLDVMLLKALIAVESGFDAAAVSPAGALGLMQIMPVSGDRYATADERRRPAHERLRDPRTNIFTGARMLADLMRRFGRVDLALAAWNAGEGRVRRAGHRLPRIAETEAHVEQVLSLYWGLLQRQQARRATELRIAAPG
jgi:soluble lytic murein transglycosylase-like protein